MLLLALSCLTSMLLSDGAVVVTTTGPVRGKLNRDHNVEYYSYEGIPYAESPTGALRFKVRARFHTSISRFSFVIVVKKHILILHSGKKRHVKLIFSFSF